MLKKIIPLEKGGSHKEATPEKKASSLEFILYSVDKLEFI